MNSSVSTENEYVQIAHLSVNHDEHIALVDSKYINHLSSLSKWYYDKDQFIRSTKLINGKNIMLHRYIMTLENKPIANMIVNYVDNNRLNNLVSNLVVIPKSGRKILRPKRMCPLTNFKRIKKSGTSSKYKGVFLKKSKKWSAQIKYEGKSKHLGTFSDEVDAARAYNTALKHIPIPEHFKLYNDI